MSKIRVTFNRQLTWAEIETFRTSFLVANCYAPKGGLYKWHFTTNRLSLYVEASLSGPLNSRDLYGAVADEAAEQFVNLHPVAVRTFED